jgi:vitamin B12 transporter
MRSLAAVVGALVMVVGGLGGAGAVEPAREAAQREASEPPGGPAAEPEARRAEPVVVTATRVDTPRAELGVAVSVVTHEDFRTYHYPTVDEALRSVPGVEIRRSGSLGKTSSVSIRGANPSQVQVLVDGVRVKSPTLGQVDLSDLSPDLIERIEVVRGPQSALYGADAIGGVVHIITRRGRGPLTATVEQQAGNRDTLASRGWAGGAHRLPGLPVTLDWAAAGSHLESNGQFVNDGSEQRALSLNLGVSLPRDTRLGFVARWNRADTDLPVKFVCCGPLPVEPVIDPNQQQQSETLTLSLEGHTRPVPWWESRVRLGRWANALGFQDPVDPGFDFDLPCRSQIDAERREAEWVNAFHAGRWSTSTVGLEYRHEEGENRSQCFGGATRFRARNHVRSVFGEQQVRLFERLFLTGGVRVEDHSVFGTEVTGRGSLAYLIRATGTRLRGSAGTGFRAPTLNDLFFPGFSNPDLSPERSLAWDAGLDQAFWAGRVRLGLTWFHTTFEDLIRFVSIPAPPFVAVVNVARARAEGLEMTLELDLLPDLTAQVAYTYTDTEDLATDRPLPREPRHRWTVGLTWEPLPRLGLWARVHTTSRQFESDAVGYNRGHTRVDAGGTWRVLDRHGWLRSLELTVRIQNLLDEGYAEVRGFPAPGIQALAGLRARF